MCRSIAEYGGNRAARRCGGDTSDDRVRRQQNAARKERYWKKKAREALEARDEVALEKAEAHIVIAEETKENYKAYHDSQDVSVDTKEYSVAEAREILAQDGSIDSTQVQEILDNPDTQSVVIHKDDAGNTILVNGIKSTEEEVNLKDDFGQEFTAEKVESTGVAALGDESEGDFVDRDFKIKAYRGLGNLLLSGKAIAPARSANNDSVPAQIKDNIFVDLIMGTLEQLIGKSDNRINPTPANRESGLAESAGRIANAIGDNLTSDVSTLREIEQEREEREAAEREAAEREQERLYEDFHEESISASQAAPTPEPQTPSRPAPPVRVSTYDYLNQEAVDEDDEDDYDYEEEDYEDDGEDIDSLLASIDEELRTSGIIIDEKE